MIEAKYIRELCDHFEAYLTPLEIKILRLRYNRKTLMLPKAVGQILHISDERVRQLEERALGDLAYCLDLEANGQEITPIRLAKSFKQPVASLICTGRWRSCSVPAYTAQRGELLIHAPHHPMEIEEFEQHLRNKQFETEHMVGYPRDCLVGRVILTNCIRIPLALPQRHQWMLMFGQPELFPTPIPYPDP